VSYEVILVTYAQETAASLPPSGQHAWETKICQLADDPYAQAAYDRQSDTWSSSFGDWGVVQFTAHDALARVVVLRVAWAG
jgi:hypothetical protein